MKPYVLRLSPAEVYGDISSGSSEEPDKDTGPNGRPSPPLGAYHGSAMGRANSLRINLSFHPKTQTEEAQMRT